MKGPSGCAPLGECAWKMRSSTPSSGSPCVIGSRCGSPEPSDVRRPRRRMISRWPLIWERSVSTLVTTSTGHGGPSPDGACPSADGPPCCAPGCPACWPPGWPEDGDCPAGGAAAGGRAPAAGGWCRTFVGAPSREVADRAGRGNKFELGMATSVADVEQVLDLHRGILTQSYA